ncbi:MAG: hypothetical protein EOR09_15815 [Mesorhizobium sp.]|nr:MAG: hypothetical protein EOR09_15815 [Mesorhizobium sp.]
MLIRNGQRLTLRLIRGRLCEVLRCRLPGPPDGRADGASQPIGLARKGVAVLRFDLTGLGSSEGEFAPTNFSSNVADLRSTVDYLRNHYRAPSLLIGYSIGGGGSPCRWPRMFPRCAIATIGAPADAVHVLKNFGTSLKEIEGRGSGHLNVGSINPC